MKMWPSHPHPTVEWIWGRLISLNQFINELKRDKLTVTTVTSHHWDRGPGRTLPRTGRRNPVTFLSTSHISPRKSPHRCFKLRKRLVSAILALAAKSFSAIKPNQSQKAHPIPKWDRWVFADWISIQPGSSRRRSTNWHNCSCLLRRRMLQRVGSTIKCWIRRRSILPNHMSYGQSREYV